MYSFDTGTDIDTGKIFTRILFLVERLESQLLFLVYLDFIVFKKNIHKIFRIFLKVQYNNIKKFFFYVKSKYPTFQAI